MQWLFSLRNRHFAVNFAFLIFWLFYIPVHIESAGLPSPFEQSHASTSLAPKNFSAVSLLIGGACSFIILSTLVLACFHLRTGSSKHRQEESSLPKPKSGDDHITYSVPEDIGNHTFEEENYSFQFDHLNDQQAPDADNYLETIDESCGARFQRFFRLPRKKPFQSFSQAADLGRFCKSTGSLEGERLEVDHLPTPQSILRGSPFKEIIVSDPSTQLPLQSKQKTTSTPDATFSPLKEKTFLKCGGLFSSRKIEKLSALSVPKSSCHAPRRTLLSGAIYSRRMSVVSPRKRYRTQKSLSDSTDANLTVMADDSSSASHDSFLHSLEADRLCSTNMLRCSLPLDADLANISTDFDFSKAVHALQPYTPHKLVDKESALSEMRSGDLAEVDSELYLLSALPSGSVTVGLVARLPKTKEHSQLEATKLPTEKCSLDTQTYLNSQLGPLGPLFVEKSSESSLSVSISNKQLLFSKNSERENSTDQGIYSTSDSYSDNTSSQVDELLRENILSSPLPRSSDSCNPDGTTSFHVDSGRGDSLDTEECVDEDCSLSSSRNCEL